MALGYILRASETQMSRWYSSIPIISRFVHQAANVPVTPLAPPPSRVPTPTPVAEAEDPAESDSLMGQLQPQGKLNIHGWFYLNASARMIQENTYGFGVTSDPASRVRAYNCKRTKDEEMIIIREFEVADMGRVEAIFKAATRPYRIDDGKRDIISVANIDQAVVLVKMAIDMTYVAAAMQVASA
jgi:hypothetical protein